jgi:hypothetical protein
VDAVGLVVVEVPVVRGPGGGLGERGGRGGEGEAKGEEEPEAGEARAHGGGVLKKERQYTTAGEGAAEAG